MPDEMLNARKWPILTRSAQTLCACVYCENAGAQPVVGRGDPGVDQDVPPFVVTEKVPPTRSIKAITLDDAIAKQAFGPVFGGCAALAVHVLETPASVAKNIETTPVSFAPAQKPTFAGLFDAHS